MPEEKTLDQEVLWEDDGRTANRPCPDWWDQHSVERFGNRLIHRYFDGSQQKMELIEDAARLVELAGEMEASDEELVKALSVLDS